MRRLGQLGIVILAVLGALVGQAPGVGADTSVCAEHGNPDVGPYCVPIP